MSLTGPTAHGKAQGKDKTPERHGPALYSIELGHGKEWDKIMAALRVVLDLPDYTTSNGLKKIHRDFGTIHAKLDTMYTCSTDNHEVKGAVVGIIGRLCADALLRDKFCEKGVLEKIWPLLDVVDARCLPVALPALATITHHAGEGIRSNIAKHSGKITKLIRELPDDKHVVEAGMLILHNTLSDLAAHSDRYPLVLRHLDVRDLLQTIIETVKRPPTRWPFVFQEAVEILMTPTLHAAAAYKAYPVAERFLIAGLRSKDWVIRGKCICALFRLYDLGSEEDNCTIDCARFLQTVFPPHLQRLLDTYGLEQTDTYGYRFGTVEFKRAMTSFSQTRDLYTLGLNFARMILKHEFSVPNGQFGYMFPGIGSYKPPNANLPFRTYADALPHMAQAIRARNKADEEDLADILDIKYFILQDRRPDAVVLAKKAVQRNPRQAYFYYTITLATDPVSGLRAAKKGLKCKQITPFVKFQLMRRAVEHGGFMGIESLQQYPLNAADKQWEMGIAFVMSALEDAKAYLQEAPPDNRYVKSVGYWYVLLNIMAREDLSPNLKELEDALKQLELSDEFSLATGIRPPNTMVRQAQRSVVKHYAEAIKEFSGIFAKFEQQEAADVPEMDSKKIEDELAPWFEVPHFEDGDAEKRTRTAWGGEKKMHIANVELYRCSWCGNPSAVLRKCGGCSKSRYCDSECQKAQWSVHKKECRKA